MAKKKEQELTYLQEPIPSSSKKYQTTKLNWSGLNYEQTVDTGALSMEKNISTEKAPYLTPSPIPGLYLSPKDLGVAKDCEYEILSIHPFDGFLIIVWHQWSGNVDETYITCKRPDDSTVYKHLLDSSADNEKYKDSIVPRSIVQFNVNNAPLNPLANDVTKKYVIFPDKKAITFDISDTTKYFDVKNIEIATKEISDSNVTVRYDSDNIKSKVTFDEEALEDSEGASYSVTETGNTYITFEFKNIAKYKYIGISKDIAFKAHVSEPKRIVFEFENSDEFAKATVRVARLEPDTTYNLIGYGMYEDGGNYYYEAFKISDTKDDTYVSVSTTNDEGTGAYYELEIGDVDKNAYYRNTSTGDVYQYNTEEEKWRKVIIPACPAIQYAVVHQSRVFGVGGSKVYASGFNDYTNWNLDTVGEYNESNAWCSSSQSNTKADGDFTGITTFQNSVLLFKKDNMQEVRNNKNPFRLLDIFNEGAVNNQSVQDVNGILIFCTGEKVITYNGGNPRIISHPLGMKKFVDPISGTDGRCYFLYCKDEGNNARLFVYDTYVGEWSERTVPLNGDAADSVVGFAHNDTGMYMACEHNGIYKLDTDTFDGQEWSFETDTITNHTVDIKHLNKFQIYAEFQRTSLKVYAIYDDKEPTEIYFGEELEGIKPIRVLIRKSANYSLKLRFEGKGYMKLHSMNLITSSGGNLYV